MKINSDILSSNRENKIKDLSEMHYPSKIEINRVNKLRHDSY